MSSIHQLVRWEPSGSHTLGQSCWINFPPRVGQEGHQSWELGTGSWLWFCLRLCIQCRVTKFFPSSGPIQSGFRKGRRWVWCAPFEEALGSNAWFHHFPSVRDDRMVHWVEVHWGRINWMLDLEVHRYPDGWGEDVSILFCDLVHLLVLQREALYRGHWCGNDLILTVSTNHKEYELSGFWNDLTTILSID